jgi:hypothetical protein
MRIIGRVSVGVVEAMVSGPLDGSAGGKAQGNEDVF